MGRPSPDLAATPILVDTELVPAGRRREVERASERLEEDGAYPRPQRPEEVEMTSRERILRAVNHQEPDRVPIDLGSTRFTGIMVHSYLRVRERLGIHARLVRIFDVYQTLAEVEQAVLDRFNVDVVGAFPLRPSWNFRIDRWKEWRLFDGTLVEVPEEFCPVTNERGDLEIRIDGKTAGKMPKNGYYFDYEYPPPRPTVEDYPKFEEMPFNPLPDDELTFMGERARFLSRETDKAVMGMFEGSYFMPDAAWMRFEDWWTALLTEKPYAVDWVGKKADWLIDNLKAYKDAVGDHVMGIAFGEDFGGQEGELFSPAIFREIYLPAMKKVFSWIHSNTPWKVFFHCCGSIFHIIDYLIEAGVDILNPVQCTAANMEPEKLKARFGDRITFWGGGVDTQTTLPCGTPEQVKEQVKERIRAFAPGGGFVFNPIHNIQQDAPAENIIAAYDAAIEAGKY